MKRGRSSWIWGATAGLLAAQISWATPPSQEDIVHHFLHTHTTGIDTPDAAAVESALTRVVTDIIQFTQLPVEAMTLERFEAGLRVLQPSSSTVAQYIPHISIRKFGGICFLDGYLEANPRNTSWGRAVVSPHKIYIDFHMFYTEVPEHPATIREAGLEIFLQHPRLGIYFSFPELPLPTTDLSAASAFFQASFSYRPNTHSVISSKQFDVMLSREDFSLLSFLYSDSSPYDALNGANPALIPFEKGPGALYERQRRDGIVPIAVIEDAGLDYNHPELMPLLFYTQPRKNLISLAEDPQPLFGFDITEGDIFPFYPAFMFIKPEFRGSELTSDDIEFSHAEMVVRIIGETPQLKSFLIAGSPNKVIKKLSTASESFRQNQQQQKNERLRTGLDVAIEHGAKVVTGSIESLVGHFFGNSSEEKTEVREELDFWASLFRAHPDVLFIFAAGNDSKSIDASSRPYDYYFRPIPQRFGDSFKNVLVVGACHRTEDPDQPVVLDDYSSYGLKTVHLCTPGTYDLPLAWQGRSPFTIQGTSASAPRIARRVGEILLEHPELTGVQAKERLFQESEKISTLADKIQEGRFIDLP